MKIIQLTQEELAHVELSRVPYFGQLEELPRIYTPAWLSADIATAANLRSMPGALVLEPSCGRGALISAALDLQPDLGIIAYDTDANAVDHVAYSTDNSNVAVRCRDFLGMEPNSLVDVVLMHPPAGADIEHVTHALTFVRPGGKLVSIMGAGWQSSPRSSGLRRCLEDLPHSSRAIRAGTFKASGSIAPASMLVVRLRGEP